jgi:hypothetical protein
MQLPAEDSNRLQVGLTYETGDEGCDLSGGDSSACKIIYRTFEL